MEEFGRLLEEGTSEPPSDEIDGQLQSVDKDLHVWRQQEMTKLILQKQIARICGVSNDWIMGCDDDEFVGWLHETT